MGNQQERRDAAVYLAAMVQGEGSVMAYWNRTGPKRYHCISARVVAVYNTDPEVLDVVHRYCLTLGVSPYRYAYNQRGGDTRKQMGSIIVNGYKRLVVFLPPIIPFLVGEKRRRAECLLEIAQTRMSVSKSAPYSPEHIAMLETFKPQGHLESSETNTPRTFRGVDVKIEPDPDPKGSGGETVREYPASA